MDASKKVAVSMLSLDMKFTADHYIILQGEYLHHFPEDFPMDLLTDYKSILRFRNYLKCAKPDRKLLIILLVVAMEKIVLKRRFQKILVLKLILHHLKCDGLDRQIVDQVFEIYQQLILTEPEEVCWKLSNLIKDRELSAEQVEWLLANYESSAHVLNRILRYPLKNRQISQWAETAINNSDLMSRQAEIIGCILNYRPKFRHKDHKALAWGIYYARLTDDEKKGLLDKHLYPDNLAEILKICERSKYTDLISKWYRDITHEMEGAKFYIPYGA